jgi:hypothetical protein
MSSSRFACPRLETDREWKEPTVLTLNNWALVLDILRNIGPILGWVNQGGIAGQPEYYHPGSDEDGSVLSNLKVLLIDQLSIYAENLYEQNASSSSPSSVLHPR